MKLSNVIILLHLHKSYIFATVTTITKIFSKAQYLKCQNVWLCYYSMTQNISLKKIMYIYKIDFTDFQMY